MALPTYAAGTAGLPELTLTAYFIPISVIAAWPKSDPNHIETRRGYIPFAIVLQILSTIAIVTRFYALFTKTIRRFGIDDVLIILAWFVAVGITVGTIWGTIYAGFDRHIWDNLAKGELAGLVTFIGEALFLLSTCLAKLSVLAFQRRLLQKTDKTKVLRAIDAGIVFVIAYFIIFLALLIFACTPINASWKSLDIRYQKPYKCRKRLLADTLVGVFSVLSDVYALIIPEMLVYSLRIDKRQKRILYFVFGSGLIVAGAGVARSVYLWRLSTDRLRDMTWVGYEIVMWGQLECQMAIVCASAPAIKAVITSKVGTLRSKNTKSSGTPLTTLSKGKSDHKSNISHTIDSELAEGKGILVTETLSLNSAVVTPNPTRERESFGLPSPISVLEASEGEPGRPSYSSQSPLERSYNQQNKPGPPTEGLPLGGMENWGDFRWSFAESPQRSDSRQAMNTFRPYNERDKAMRILGE